MVAVASGPAAAATLQPRARSRRALRGARAALVEAEVGRLRAESRRAADDADAQLGWPRGSLRGSPTPPISARGAPARAAPARAVRRPPRPSRPRPRDRKGAVKARMYRGKRS